MATFTETEFAEAQRLVGLMQIAVHPDHQERVLSKLHLVTTIGPTAGERIFTMILCVPVTIEHIIRYLRDHFTRQGVDYSGDPAELSDGQALEALNAMIASAIIKPQILEGL